MTKLNSILVVCLSILALSAIRCDKLPIVGKEEKSAGAGPSCVNQNYDVATNQFVKNNGEPINCVDDEETEKYLHFYYRCEGDDTEKGYVQTGNGIVFCSNSGCSAKDRERGCFHKRSSGELVMCGFNNWRDQSLRGNCQGNTTPNAFNNPFYNQNPWGNYWKM